MDLKPWQKLSSAPAGNFRIFTIRADRVISPRTQQAHEVYVIDCVNWVNVIAVTPDRHLVMIEQYRHGSTTVELEIPGGMIDAKDAPPPRRASANSARKPGMRARTRASSARFSRTRPS